jgi:hypothetical protein
VLESYQNLREDPAQTTVDLLRYISHQLANSSLPAVPDPIQFHAEQSDIQVNVCWFVSLVLSLVVALFGIFFKQWMRSYMKWTDVSSYKNAVELRHFRYRTLESWHIETILALLPTLLQIAVLLFLGGLLTFLWGSVPSLTIVMAVLSCIACFLVVAATILPGFSQLCPYRSSLSRFIALPIRYVLDHVKSALKSSLQFATSTFIQAKRSFSQESLPRWRMRSRSTPSGDQSGTTPPTSWVQKLLPRWLVRRSAPLGDPPVTTLSTSWVGDDEDTILQRIYDSHVSIGVGAMVHLCCTTQSPPHREASIVAIMSEYSDYRLEILGNDAYCDEVWWPIVGRIMKLEKEEIGSWFVERYGPSLLFSAFISRFKSLPLSMQHCWLNFLMHLEGFMCRPDSGDMIKAYLVCCTSSVDSHGGGRRMLALVAVLRTHHLNLEKAWFDSIADYLSMSASIWMDNSESDVGRLSPYKWDTTSGVLFHTAFVCCVDHTSGGEFIKRMQRFCDELQDVKNLTATQTGKYQRLLDLLAQLACQVALAMEPEPREHVPDDLKSFLVALRRIHQVCPPYPSNRISGSCATALVFVARSDEPDLFPKPFARAMVRQIESSHLLAVAQDVAGLDLDGVDMDRLGASWDDLDARSRGVIERLIEPEPFKKILVVYEGDVRGRG